MLGSNFQETFLGRFALKYKFTFGFNKLKNQKPIFKKQGPSYYIQQSWFGYCSKFYGLVKATVEVCLEISSNKVGYNFEFQKFSS